jgi:hypothetical protein
MSCSSSVGDIQKNVPGNPKAEKETSPVLPAMLEGVQERDSRDEEV